MKANWTAVFIFTLLIALAASPVFAQRGGGVGVGLGNQTKVGGGGAGVGVGTGAGAGAGAQAGGANVGVGANTDVHANTQVKAGGNSQPDAKSHAQPNEDFVSRIEGNSQLAARVQSMLPTGESINGAAAGFKNEGQFLAALHASHNLNIPFDDLKAKMTGSGDASLGSSIHALKPNMSEKQSKDEAKKAEADAKATASAKARASSQADSKATR